MFDFLQHFGWCKEPTGPIVGGLPNTVAVLGVSWNLGVTFAYLSWNNAWFSGIFMPFWG